MMTETLRADFARLAALPDMNAAFAGKRIYLTGATGQIGWYLVRYLCHQQTSGKLSCELTAHVRSAHRLAEKYPDHAQLPCTFAISDKAADTVPARCDLLIHCASLASPRYFAEQPVDVMTANGLLTGQLLERLKTDSPACQFVYLSTTGVTGFIPDDQRPSSEETYGPLSSIDLTNCYLESKRFGEMLTLAFARQHGLQTLVVRPSITYGPGFDLEDGRSYADFVRALLEKRPIKLSSDGSAIRNFLYIADFIHGLSLAISRAPAQSVLNIASPDPISIKALATLLTASVYPESLGEVESAPPRQSLARVEFRSTDASVDKIRALGWEPHTVVLDGFKRTLAHYEECLKGTAA